MSQLETKVNKKDGLKREIKVSVPSTVVELKKKSRFEAIAKKAKLPGFRPGKAPINIIENQYGNQVNQEVLSEVLETTYAEVIQDQELEPAGPPEVSVDQFVDGSDFKYTANIEVLPEFKLKGIDDIKVEKLISTVTQSDINEMIENLQKQRGEWTVVDKLSEKGNQLLIDFVGKIDDEPFEGGSADDFVIEVGSGQMLPEFDQALEGVKSGDEKEFNLTFPEDYHKEDLSNKVAVFNIKVKEVKELEPAEISHEFVKGFGIESGQSEDLMKEIKDSMEKEKEGKIKNDLRINLMKYLRENNEIDIPSVMVHREAHAMQKDWMRQSGIEDEEKALPVSNFEEIASERVHLGLLVNELVISRELKLDDDKVETKLEEITKAYPNGDEIRKMYEQTPELMDQLKSMVMEDQVVDWLTDHSTFTEKEIEFKELINKQQ